MAKGSGWGVLVALGKKSQEAKHLNRSLDKTEDVTTAELEAGDISLSLVKTIVGRMLMNAEGTARAANQVADILIDVPSGASWSSEETPLVGWLLAIPIYVGYTAQIQKYKNTTNGDTQRTDERRKSQSVHPPPLPPYGTRSASSPPDLSILHGTHPL